jgi:L,D-peptidoglycan transpeptidase YkuD (ErfK/YbiS/YcfS/YnhG family)
MRSLVTPFVLTVCLSASSAAMQQPLHHSRQLLVVTTNSWPDSRGTMSIFERESDSLWRQRGPKIDVVVGRAGLGWGRGVIETKSFTGPVKHEGDDRAPAGVFRLGRVFGFERETKMPFARLSKNMVAVDDPRSRYYNLIVDASKIDNADWKHAEKLFGVDVYKWGIVVEHNAPPQPGAGSCIFLHIWKNASTSTSGCTAVSERDLFKIIRWLDPEKNPLLVQIPRPVYRELRAKWHLP